MNPPIKISVIIPVYNLEGYIERAINSVRRQTYQHLEILIVNDGSNDSSEQICHSLAHADSRIVLINQSNQGLSCARNAAIERATGAFLAFVDGDDWIEPDMYAYLLTHALSFGAEIAACGYHMVDETGAEIRRQSDIIEKKEYVFHTALEALHFVLESSNVTVCNKLYRKELFANVRFPAGRTFEDVATMHRLVEQVHTMVMLPDIKYHYLTRSGSIMNSPFQKSNLDELEAYINRHSYLAQRYPQLEPLCRKYIFIGLLNVLDHAWPDISQWKEILLEQIQKVKQYDPHTCGLRDDVLAMVSLVIQDASLRSFSIAKRVQKNKNANP